jgi:hypothetical protein
MPIHRKVRIEQEVNKAVERVKKKEHSEDSLVELKATWPKDHAKSARQIAGLCNAAGGAEVLWIIGLDEDSQIFAGADQAELANWWPSVSTFFEGQAPSMFDLNVTVDGKTYVALAFETDRPPYVVKVEKEDRLEVPWREGRATRSAKRSELARLLYKQSTRPNVSIASAQLIAFVDGNKNKALMLRVDLLVEPVGETAIILGAEGSHAFVHGGEPTSVGIDVEFGKAREIQAMSDGAVGLADYGVRCNKSSIVRLEFWSPSPEPEIPTIAGVHMRIEVSILGRPCPMESSLLPFGQSNYEVANLIHIWSVGPYDGGRKAFNKVTAKLNREYMRR